MLGFRGRPDTGTFDVGGWCCIHGYGRWGNSSAGPEIEGVKEGGNGDDEGVSDEGCVDRQDDEVCEYKMEVVRI